MSLRHPRIPSSSRWSQRPQGHGRRGRRPPPRAPGGCSHPIAGPRPVLRRGGRRGHPDAVPTTTELVMATPNRSAAARKRSGSAWQRDLVAGDDRHRRRHSQLGEIGAGGRLGALVRSPRGHHAERVAEQLDRPGQRPNVRCEFTEDASVARLQRRHLLRGELPAISLARAFTSSPLLMPTRRWMRQVERSRPSFSSAVRQAITCW